VQLLKKKLKVWCEKVSPLILSPQAESFWMFLCWMRKFKSQWRGKSLHSFEMFLLKFCVVMSWRKNLVWCEVI
jgi:hypothetical protein